MFEDNPLEPSPFVFDSNDVFATLADIDSFNFSSPSSGHRSPVFPTIPAIAEPQSELNNAWFNLSNINDDSLNVKSIASPGTPWDFLTFDNDSPDSGATSTSGAFSPTFAIDPQLMATPATSKSLSDFGDDDAAKDEHPHEEDDEDDDDGPVTPPPVKPSNKGKDRKSGVLSGGVQKKIHFSSVVKTDPYDNPLDDWRPTPEEYQKMSSREKRQLRNKISARNFRNRRKEYITTLEGDVAERDRLIDAIRTELGSTRSENAALQQEIKTLKKALLSSAGRADSPALPPPSPLPISSRSSASTSPLLTPNTHKDLPATASPRLAAKGFWGGSSTSFGGITPVHTVTIPDLIAGAALKPALQENINPALNNNINSVGLSTLGGPGKPPPFDSFMDTNPFTMKMLDAYRMQLWTRMAQHQQQHQQAASSQHQQQQHPSSPPLSGLAANLRPHYFSSTPTLRSAASSSSLSSLLSGKHHIHTSAFTSASSSTAAAPAYPTPPASPNPSSTSASSSAQMPTPQQAALATMASQTLVQRLGSAFWQAFSGSPSSYPPSSHTAPNARAPAWDAEKVRRVLEGTAVVRVVDVESPSGTGTAEAVKATATAASMVAVKEFKEVQTQTQSQGQMTCAKLCAARETGLGVLEESMRALTLGKKGSA
ncbi:hypothetical protein EDB87DRAFT_1809886 [Lactarius vividus]|nr:hypothetical protein EDB87DRAFT_1809886 [Lactarius vividus]